MKMNYAIVALVAFCLGVPLGLSLAPKPPRPPPDCVPVLMTDGNAAMGVIWPAEQQRYRRMAFTANDRTEVDLFLKDNHDTTFRFIFRRGSAALLGVSLSFKGELDRATTEDLIHVVKALGHTDPQGLADELAKVWGHGESLGDSTANVGRFNLRAQHFEGETYIDIRPSDNQVHWFYLAAPDVITHPPKSLYARSHPSGGGMGRHTKSLACGVLTIRWSR